MTTESTNQPASKSRFRRNARVPAALLTVVVVLAWQADLFSSKVSAGEVDDTRPRADPGEIEEVRWDSVPRRRILVGAVAPRAGIELSARISGQMLELRVEEGSRVAKGGTVATLDRSVPAAARDEAAAALAMAEAEQLGASRLFERVRQAVEARAMPEIERVKAERARDSSARAVERARAALDAAEARLAFTRIESPADGVVLETLKDPGDQVLAGQPVLLMYDPGQLEIEVGIPEKLAASLETGDRATCRIEALGLETEATVRVLVPGADPASHTVMAKLQVELPAGAAPGMYVRVALDGEPEKTLLIPASAVERVRQLDFVRVVDRDDRVHRRMVRLGRRIDDEVVVLGGLRPSERIVRRPSPAKGAAESPPTAPESLR